MGRALILDAGALIALEKGDLHVAGLVETCLDFGLPIIVPTSVLAQVWRGGAVVDPLDENRAKEAGVRLGARGAADIADAHVVCCTVELQATAVTSDPEDLRTLVEPGEPLALIVV